MARVIRDESGQIVDLIEYSEEDHVETTPWGKPVSYTHLTLPTILLV